MKKVDPRVFRFVALVVSVSVYGLAAFVEDQEFAFRLRELAALLFGSQAVRRAGDLPPPPSDLGDL